MDEGVLAAAAADNQNAHVASYRKDAGRAPPATAKGRLKRKRERIGLSWRKSTRAGGGAKALGAERPRRRRSNDSPASPA